MIVTRFVPSVKLSLIYRLYIHVHGLFDLFLATSKKLYLAIISHFVGLLKLDAWLYFQRRSTHWNLQPHHWWPWPLARTV